MRLKTLIAAASVVLGLVACATTPIDPVDIARTHVNDAMIALQNQDENAVRSHIVYVLTLSGQENQVTQFFESNPTAVVAYVNATTREIQDITEPTKIATERVRLDLIQLHSILPDSKIQTLRSNLIERSKKGNLDGTIGFTLSDNLWDLSILESTKHAEIIVDRTIERAASSKQEAMRQIPSLMAYAAEPSTPIAQKEKIGSSLGSLNITRKDLKYIQSVYPEFVKELEATASIKAQLVYSGGDKLDQADLQDTLQTHIKGVIWQDGQSATVVKVERLRHNEREEQPRSETVRYSDLDVDFITSAFYMPRYSSYLFEITSSPISIEYGYEITVLADGKENHSEIIRGTLNETNTTCSNARIENAFGGTSPVNFYANNDMRRRCEGSNKKTLKDLRSKVDAEIAKSILKSPMIDRVHSFNK